MRKQKQSKCGICKWEYPVILLECLMERNPERGSTRFYRAVCPICALKKLQRVMLPQSLWKELHCGRRAAERWRKRHPDSGPA